MKIMTKVVTLVNIGIVEIKAKTDALRLKNGQNTKQENFWYIRICGKCCVKIVLIILQNNRSDSVFNQIFDYVHGTHCLTSSEKYKNYLLAKKKKSI